jgi:hypothetical protein
VVVSEPLYREEWIALLVMCQDTIAKPPANLNVYGFAALLRLAEKVAAHVDEAPSLRDLSAPTGQVPS